MPRVKPAALRHRARPTKRALRSSVAPAPLASQPPAAPAALSRFRGPGLPLRSGPVVVHLYDRFEPTKRNVFVARPQTVRHLVSKHPQLRRHTSVRRRGGVYAGRKVREFNRATVCFVNDQVLPRAQWKHRVVTDRDVVTFWAPPAGPMGGGGGGGGGSNPIGIILAIAIAVAVPYLGPIVGGALFGLAGAAAAGSFAAIAGSVIVGVALSAVAYGIMSLFSQPPPPSSSGAYNGGYGGGAQAPSPTYSLGAQGNTARLGQPIPELIGRHQVYPDFVAEPYIRYVDNEQYIHSLLGVSIGEVDLEELRIGDTPIASFEEIVYEQLGPGETPDPEIADPRWLSCKDIAQVELPGSGDGSPYKGPFMANQAHTEISFIEVDHVAQNGFYKYNTGTGGLDAKSATIVVEGRLVDEEGEPLGDWTELDTLTLTNTATREPVRWTNNIEVPAEGRWEIQEKRTDAEDTDLQAGHRVDWIGLRGYLTTERTFPGITVLGVRMKATGDLNGQTSRRLNAIATRKLPTWDEEEEEMTTAVAATRSPCDAYAYIARSQNGGRLADSAIDLAGLYANKEEFEEAGWTFDFVFDQPLTTDEALRRVARAVVAESVEQGGKIRLVRDIASDAPVAMFGPRNILPRSLEMEYATITAETADGVTGQYMSPSSWRPFDVTVAFDDSPQLNLSNILGHGITNREQLRAVLWNFNRSNRYRRKVYRWRTEMDGLVLLFGDPVSLSYDFPGYGQTAEVVAFDEANRVLALTEDLTFTEGQTHYIAVRNNLGKAIGPFEVEAVDGEPRQVQFVEDPIPEDLPEILTGGDAERTVVQFGPGAAYSKKLKVIQVDPQDESHALVIAVDDAPEMYADLPEDDTAPDPGVPQEPIEIAIDADVANLNLRTLAGAHGYAGLFAQQVTFTVESGVEVYSTSASVAAIVRGTWPAMYVPKLIVRGTVTGAGGNAGAGGGTTISGRDGQAGGDALDARSGPLELDYDTGTLRSGGGGGGGGGISAEANGFDPAFVAGGGGGGGGRGRSPGALGAGGVGSYSSGSNGTAGSTGAAGTGAAGGALPGVGYVGGGGGNGGTLGTAGSDGVTGRDEAGTVPAYAAGRGGAAGKSIRGFDNVTVTGTPGTLVGPTAA